MKSVGMLNLAALVASATVLALAAVLFPEQLSLPVAIASLVVFALSVGFAFYVPSILARKRSGSDAAQMASLGPAGVISALLLVLTATGFCLARAKLERLALAADILAVGGLVVGGLIVRASLGVIEEVAASYSGPSRHGIWQGELLAMASVVSDTATKGGLEKVADTLRYAASDVLGGSPQDSEIDSLIKEATQEVASDSSASLKAQMSRLEMLLAQREVYLRSSRSKV